MERQNMFLEVKRVHLGQVMEMSHPRVTDPGILLST